MNIELPYGDDKVELIEIELPSICKLTQLKTKSSDSIISSDDFQRKTADKLGSFFSASDKILIILNDSFRNTPSTLILDWIKQSNDYIINQSDFMIATGTHRPPTDSEVAKLLGAHYQDKVEQIFIHDSKDNSGLTKIGVDQFGGDVKINSKLLEYDKILIIGSVEPHYFAGFTGGRKSLIPGLADFATIERNHNLANSLDAKPLKLTGNPVAEHLDSLLSLINCDNIFSIQLVLDSDSLIAGCYSGNVRESFVEASNFSRKTHSLTVENQFDIVIALSAPPLDRNLYQIQKSLENCQSAVKDGGDIVLISKCSEGIGSDYFLKLARNWDRIKNQPIDGKISFGSHKLSRVIEISKRISVSLYSDIEPSIAKDLFFKKIDNLQSFIDIRAKNSDNISVAVVQDAGNFVVNYV